MNLQVLCQVETADVNLLADEARYWSTVRPRLCGRRASRLPAYPNSIEQARRPLAPQPGRTVLQA